MDPQVITTAIVAAITTGLSNGVKETGKKLIVDSYARLKSKLFEKFGKDNKISKAIEEVEKEPEFEPHKAALKTRIEQSDMTEDSEVVSLIEELLTALNSLSPGQVNVHISDNGQVGIIGNNTKFNGNITFNSKE